MIELYNFNEWKQEKEQEIAALKRQHDGDAQIIRQLDAEVARLRSRLGTIVGIATAWLEEHNSSTDAAFGHFENIVALAKAP